MATDCKKPIDLGSRFLDEKEKVELKEKKLIGIIDEKGMFYSLFGSPSDTTLYHDGLAAFWAGRGNKDLKTFLKFNTSCSYFDFIYKNETIKYVGNNLPRSIAVGGNKENFIRLTNEMAVALYNIYSAYTPFVSEAFAKYVEGLGWSNTDFFKNKETMKFNQHVLSTILDKRFDMKDFLSELKDLYYSM